MLNTGSAVRQDSFASRGDVKKFETILSQINEVQNNLARVNTNVNATLDEFQDLAQRSKDNGVALEHLMKEIKGVRQYSSDGAEKLTGLAQLELLKHLKKLDKLEILDRNAEATAKLAAIDFSPLNNLRNFSASDLNRLNELSRLKLSELDKLGTLSKDLLSLNSKLDLLPKLKEIMQQEASNGVTKEDFKLLEKRLEQVSPDRTREPAQVDPAALDGLKHLENLNKLSQLDLLDSKLSSLAQLSELSRLENLEKTLEKISQGNQTKQQLDELKTSLVPLEALENLTKLDSLGTNHSTVVEKLESLEKLEKLSQLGALAKLDRLDALANLDQLSGLGDLEKLQQLGRLDQLSQLSQLKTLDQLDQLHKLDELSRLEKLDELAKLDQKVLGTLDTKLEQLNKLNQLNQLNQLEVLPQIDQKLESLAGLSQLSKLNSLEKLAGLDNLSQLSGIPQILESNTQTQGEMRAVLDHLLGEHTANKQALRQAQSELSLYKEKFETLSVLQDEINSRQNTIKHLEDREKVLLAHNAELKGDVKSSLVQLEMAQKNFSTVLKSLGEVKVTSSNDTNTMIAKHQVHRDKENDIIVPKRQMRSISVQNPN